MIKSKGTMESAKHFVIGKCRILLILLLIINYPVFSNGYPGEYLINQMWRDANSSHSPLTNTSMLTDVNFFSAYLSHAMTLKATYQISEAIVLYPVGRIHTFGLTYSGSGAQINSSESSQWDDNGNIVKTGQKLSDRSNVFIVSYAVNPLKSLSLGINAQFIYHPIFNNTYTGYGGDISISYKVLDDERLGKHTLGIATHNLILAGNTGYSSAATLSWYGHLFDNQIVSQLDINVKDFLAATTDYAEGKSKSIDFDVNYKIGAWLFKLAKLYGHVGTQYFGFSGGIDIPTLKEEREISVLYQWTRPFEGAGPAHSFLAGAEFGEPRKEAAAKAQKRKASLIPSNLYNKAMQLYSEGKYWDAYWVFSKIMVEYPDFIKNDWVSYYSGRCLEMLDIRTTALSQFQRTLIRFSKSKASSFANSGMMSINYREDNTSEVEKYYRELVNAHVPDSLTNHAHYLRGETYLKDQDYDNAINLLGKVPKDHVDFMYARHSMAVASILKDDYDKALVYLKECLGGTAKTPADEEIVNRTFLFTGYLFYEEKEYANALAALSMIPKKSLYYEDALLGMAWISLQAQQWEDCIGAAQDLRSITKWVVNMGEGYLLEAYAHLMQKNYKTASDLLSTASSMLNSAAIPSEDSLRAHVSTYRDIRANYEALGKTAEAFGMEIQTTEILEKIDSLHIDQKDLKMSIDNHFKYVDDFNRESFFSRNFEMVRNDVDYALARSLKMSALKKAVAEQQKSEQKAQDIDKEIEKLKEEMEKEIK